MGVFQSIFLGFIQGLTEFLPISSSAHLVIFQNLLGIKEPAVFFDICVHMGTLLAVFIYYRKKIKDLFLSCFDFDKIKKGESKDFKLVIIIIAGSIPTALTGLVIKQYAQIIFSSVIFTGSMLIVTASFLAASKFIPENRKKAVSSELTLKKGFIIGLVQGFAVFPGISRSGSTIVTGLFLGLEKKEAASFSFLLSIPAILGAHLLSIRDVSINYLTESLASVLAGTVISFITGYLALILLIKIVNKGKLFFFAPYCAIAGLLCIILSII